MDVSIERAVRADTRKVFGLVAAVEDWPRILPHYRWVRILASDGAYTRTVEMAARRDVVGRLGFPLRWTAVERVHPAEARIEFEHVGGITRGMRVAWTIVPSSKDPGLAVLVRVRHVFEPRWPVPDGLVRAIVGDYFVNGVARRTLGRLAELAQGPS
jgi:ribosome-associated toxin RatA of RatAB toxin-antitoxin module